MSGGTALRYADAGNLLQRVDDRSITTNYVYADGDGLLSAIQYPASTSLNVGLSYDGYDRLTSMSDGTGSHSYSYDDNDALTSETTTYTGISGKTLNYGYYNDGSRSSMTGASGSFAYYYDGAGRMTSVVNPYSETTAWSYLNNNWLKTQQLANNATTTYTYDALARVTDLVTRTGPNPMDTLLSSFTGMVYDGAGNRTYMSASIPAHTAYSGNTSYTYDSKDQLTQESSTRAGSYTNNFSYDSAGNSTSFKGTSHSYNSNNQDTGNTYDGNGNPTTYSGTTCTFDPENRMTAFGSVLTATYRGDGLRAKTVTGAGTTYFLYDGAALLAEMNSSGSLTAVVTWGAGGLASRSTSGGSTLYTFDPQGSVVHRLDGSGTVLTSPVFDAHGTTASTGTGDCYGYCAQWGYYTDAATGLELLTHRYYDPANGRFTTRDPIGSAGGINPYEYALNGPVDGVDPTGLKIQLVGTPGFKTSARKDLNIIRNGGPLGRRLVDDLINSKLVHTITEDPTLPLKGVSTKDTSSLPAERVPCGSDTQFSYRPQDAKGFTADGAFNNSTITLAHELGHAWLIDRFGTRYDFERGEISASVIENDIRAELHMKPRPRYDGFGKIPRHTPGAWNWGYATGDIF